MVVLNTGLPTRFSTQGFTSFPDVSFAGCEIGIAAEWTTLESIGMDHLPIQITLQAARSKRPARRPPIGSAS